MTLDQVAGPVADPIADPGAGTGALTRAFALYRRTATSRSALLLLAANAIPLVGVLFFGWSLLTILVLYWLENGIVGFWNVPKILLAQGSIIPTLPALPPEAALAASASRAQVAALRDAWLQARQARQAPATQPAQANQARALADGSAAGGFGVFGGAGRAVLAVFFCIHYGIFWFVHGVFVFTLPVFAGSIGSTGAGGPGGSGCPPDLPAGLQIGALDCSAGPFGNVVWSSVAIAGVALFLSHGASFLFNYVGRGEYRTASPTGQMGSVYGRVVVLHVTIIFGAIAAAALGAPIGALLVLVAAKTAFDLGLHLRERRRADTTWLLVAAASAPVAPANPTVPAAPDSLSR